MTSRWPCILLAMYTAPSLLRLPADRLVVTRNRKGVKESQGSASKNPAPICQSGHLKK